MNLIILTGNVGNDPEIRTVGDSKVALISLGVTKRGYTTKDGRKIEDRTTWFRVGIWRGLAEVVEKFVKKGDRLSVVGEMLSREYEKDGVKYTAWEVTASEIELLTPKKDGNKASSPTQSAPASQAAKEDDDQLPF
ncbi:single-stranded DNA-binding protein [Bacteroides sp. OM08-17BH]|uniref:single-stranded DNA-binding protein n=1 Tax=Bacteroides sp. OM08-17BH TaxID=2292285 RepID=UPI000E43F76D|nr:single-stranded DNA-binding protein [Bacteroides sp. OM08-17BH]RGM25314.1 single-stranded DNA-binding protein [Bacteroides sp. OM08-17BH]